jgi:hypothetical protein
MNIAWLDAKFGAMHFRMNGIHEYNRNAMALDLKLCDAAVQAGTLGMRRFPVNMIVFDRWIKGKFSNEEWGRAPMSQ